MKEMTGSFQDLKTQRGLQAVKSSAAFDIPKPGDVVLVYAPHSDQTSQRSPGLVPRMAVVLGISGSTNPNKPPVVALSVGRAITAQEASKYHEDKESADHIVHMWMNPEGQKAVHWRFDPEATVHLPWSHEYKGRSFGGPLQGSLDPETRNLFVQKLNARQDKLSVLSSVRKPSSKGSSLEH